MNLIQITPRQPTTAIPHASRPISPLLAVLAAIALSVVLPGISIAQSLQWVQRPVPGPSPLYLSAMAYDSSRGVSVLFGGGMVSGNVNETWEWNGNAWAQQNVTAPPARYYHAMAYDTARGECVMFGGYAFDGIGRQDDTWVWNGTVWTQKLVSGPTPRFGHAMVYDADRAQVVLFGGAANTGYSNETWVWNGTAWTQRAMTGPSPRYAPGLAYDSARGVTVLFGGERGGSLGASNETWEWDGTTWTQKFPAGPVPSPRSDFAIAYDAGRGVTVLHGGFNVNDTWEWDGTTWTRRDILSPQQYFYHSAAYDSARGVVVVTAGNPGHPFVVGNNKTWVLCAPTTITGQPLSQSICSGSVAHFSVAATGSGTITYQWQIEAPAQSGTWTTLATTLTALPCGGTAQASAPQTSSTDITVTPCPGVAAYRVRCVASGTCGTTNSDPASLNVQSPQSVPVINNGISYDASLGTLPTDQGWSIGSGSGVAYMTGAVLNVTTNYTEFSYGFPMQSFRWADGQQFEARLRAPIGQVLPPTSNSNGIRATYIGGSDADGRIVYAWVWSTGVALTTHHLQQLGPGLGMLPFDAASAPHTYKVVTDAAGAKLLIDGVEHISLPYTTASSSGPGFYFVNDSRVTGLAVTEWNFVRFGSGGSGQPSNTVACIGVTANFSVVATGEGTLLYAWRKDGIPINTNANPSAATSTLAVSYVQPADEGAYDCVISTSCGASVTSSAATLVVEFCCFADFNHDNGVDFFDYLDFVDAFSTQSPAADINGDGSIDFFDYLDFVDAFSVGC